MWQVGLAWNDVLLCCTPSNTHAHTSNTSYTLCALFTCSGLFPCSHVLTWYLSALVGSGQDYFVFFQKDESLKLYTCHIFKCASERAFDIATAVGRAFSAYANQLEQYGGDPFKALQSSSQNEQSQLPKSLLKKQVRRSNLTSLKPIGAGQFGQVYLAQDTSTLSLQCGFGHSFPNVLLYGVGSVPNVLLYGLGSVPSCVLPYKYRKRLRRVF